MRGIETMTALQKIEQAQRSGALVFTNIENMQAKVDLYRTEVTILQFKESDFHEINGKYVPSRVTTDRIGEACGIQFIKDTCRVTPETREDSICGKRTAYCAEAQGKVRMPDGSWRTSTVDEYEFDPVLRAMLDKKVIELTDETKKIVGRGIMEYIKVARQRAATGARVRVIRQLTGMPAAFDKSEALKPMVFTRIVQNTDYILRTPEGRAMATAQALGLDVASLFGPRNAPALPPPTDKIEEPYTPPEPADPEPKARNTTAHLAAQAAADDELDFPEDDEGETRQEETEFDRLTGTLEEYMSYREHLDVTTKSGVNPYKMAQNELESNTATEESRRKMIKRLREFLVAKHVKGVS